MDIHLRIIFSIISLLVLISLAALLKRWKVVDESQGRTFSKLITKVTLPALIFISIARTELEWNEGILVIIMVAVTLICLAAGWAVARGMHLDRRRSGAVILTTGFGSSSLLGFALIAEVFPGDSRAMAEAVIVSGIGVQPALFIFGTMIAIYYGEKVEGTQSALQAARRYFYSPISLAFIAGLAASHMLTERSHPVLKSVFDAVHVIGSANTFLVTLTVGVLLQFSDLRQIAPIACCVAGVKLVLMPLLLWLSTLSMTLPEWQSQVLILEGAMPSAMIAAVLCKAYGCDAGFAAKLILATTLPSAITVPILFDVLG